MLDSDDLESASKLQVGLIAYWWIQGYATEARCWSEELLAHADSLDPASAAAAGWRALRILVRSSIGQRCCSGRRALW
jgi:hypothetical protein